MMINFHIAFSLDFKTKQSVSQSDFCVNIAEAQV